MSLREDIVKEAVSWVGTPYHHHGRLKGLGVDCVQLLCCVYASCKASGYVDPGTYAVDWHLHQREELYVAGLEAQGAVQVERPHLGDVCLFKIGRTYSHGGIYVGDDGMVVHAYMGSGTIMTRLSEAPLNRFPVKFFALPSMESAT